MVPQSESHRDGENTAIGDAIAQAFADLLGTTSTEGGYIAGIIFTAAFFVVFLILTGKLKGAGIMPVGGLVIGAVASRLMGWWPDWPIALTALFLAVVAVAPFGRGGD